MRSSRRKFCVAFILSAAVVAGCGYPEVSDVGYKYCQALISVCGRKANDKIEVVSAQISASYAKEEISESELALLNSILDLARDGEWQRASNTAREVMKAQVKR